MKRSELKKQPSLEFDEHGAQEVSEQILNSFNSGYINKEGQHAELNDLVEYS